MHGISFRNATASAAAMISIETIKFRKARAPRIMAAPSTATETIMSIAIDLDAHVRRRAARAATLFPPVPMAVREIAVTLAGAADGGIMERELAEAAACSAFTLEALHAVPGAAPGLWTAAFRLRAERGVVGDAQIYALLRLLSDTARWVEVRKLPMGGPAALAENHRRAGAA
jgi:hypothetical protein